MVIDTSAILALLFNEPGADAIEAAFERDPVRLISAASSLEAAIIVEARLGAAGGREFDLLMHKAGIDVVAVSDEQAAIARTAWRRFGRGRHEAELNFGDCLAYALVSTSGEPLLAAGHRFARTDVALVTHDRD
jgi:ribonuclease VapC